MTDHRVDPTQPSRERVLGAGIVWLSRWTLRWLVIAFGVALIVYLVAQLWSTLLPIVLALVLCTVLQPPALWLERRARLNPAAAAATVVLGAVGLLALGVLFLAPSVGDQVTQVANNASDGLAKLQDQTVKRSLE